MCESVFGGAREGGGRGEGGPTDWLPRYVLSSVEEITPAKNDNVISAPRKRKRCS